MAKIDELKEIKSDLKEIFKALLYLILAMLTGIVTIIYNILINSIPAHLVVFGGLGLLIVFLISIYTINIWNKMQEINKEMKDA